LCRKRVPAGSILTLRAPGVVGGVEARQADGLPLERYEDLPRPVSVARA
jgi:hypothetical protein